MRIKYIIQVNRKKKKRVKNVDNNKIQKSTNFSSVKQTVSVVK